MVLGKPYPLNPRISSELKLRNGSFLKLIARYLTLTVNIEIGIGRNTKARSAEAPESRIKKIGKRKTSNIAIAITIKHNPNPRVLIKDNSIENSELIR